MFLAIAYTQLVHPSNKVALLERLVKIYNNIKKALLNSEICIGF